MEISTLTALIGCAIGVAGFYVGSVSRAKQDGRMLEKIDQCCKGIEDLKADNKERNAILSEHSKILTSHDEKLEFLLREINK